MMLFKRNAVILLVAFFLLSTAVFSLQAAPMPNPAQPTAEITSDATAAGTAGNRRLLGTKLPAGLGSWRTEKDTVINRTTAAGGTSVVSGRCCVLRPPLIVPCPPLPLASNAGQRLQSVRA